MKFGFRDILALGLSLAAAGLAYGFVLDLALVGWDSYPILATSQPSELGTTLFDRWMGGRYPRGDFYRPLSTLGFAVDVGLWGMTPRGFQWGNLLTLCFATGCVYGLTRAWFGSALTAAAAALCFALHPAQIEVVPVVARRSDLLAAGLMAAALWAQPTAPGASRARLLLGGGLALLATAAKETGVAVLPAIVAWHACLAPAAHDVPTRLRYALARSAPAIAAVAAFLVLRSIVLGGLGGHPDSNLFAGALAGALAAPAWLASLVMPQPWTETALDVPLAGGAWIALAVSVRFAWRDLPLRAPFIALAVWTASLLMLMGVSGDRASWYLVPLVTPYAMLLAILASWARTATPALPARLAGGTCAVLLIGLVATSSLVRDYGSWRAVSRANEEFLAAFDDAIERNAGSGTITVVDLPLGTGAPLDRIGVRSALGLSDYSVAAYAELRFPERRIDVVTQADTGTESGSETLRVKLVPREGPLAAAWRGAQP